MSSSSSNPQDASSSEADKRKAIAAIFADSSLDEKQRARKMQVCVKKNKHFYNNSQLQLFSLIDVTKTHSRNSNVNYRFKRAPVAEN